MYSLLLAIIYIAFVSLGLPDSLIGAGWPVMQQDLGVPVAFAGIVTMIIAVGTILSSLASERVTRRFGVGIVTAASVGMTAAALGGFSFSGSFWMRKPLRRLTVAKGQEACRQRIQVEIRPAELILRLWRGLVERVAVCAVGGMATPPPPRSRASARMRSGPRATLAPR